MRKACVWGLLLLCAGAAAQVPEPAPESVQRAAVLVYRSQLHPQGAAYTLAARLLSEQARTGGDAAALDALREQILALLQHHDPAPVSGLMGAPSDAVAALLEAKALPDTGVGLLLPAWQAVVRQPELDALVPELLRLAQRHAGEIWLDLLQQNQTLPPLASAAAPLIQALAGAPADAGLAAWLEQDPPLTREALSTQGFDAWLEQRQGALFAALAAWAGGEAPAWDAARGARHRARLFVYRHAELDASALTLARWYLGLARQIPAAGHTPTGFLRLLTSGAQALARSGEPLDAPTRAALQALADQLASLRESPPPQWTATDAAFPDMLADAVALIRRLAQTGDPAQYQAIGHDLMRLQARIALLAEDWGAYLAQPFREPVQHALSECLPPPEAAEARAECFTRARDWALQGAGIPEASGSIEGPFQAEYVLRELQLNPWQRVNYLRGYWQKLINQACSPLEQTLNALEWSLGARIYLALLPAGHDGAESDLVALTQAGAGLVRDLTAFAACRAEGAGLVSRLLDRYGEALAHLEQALPGAIQAFRAQALAPGADVRLDAGPAQATGYVPEGLQVSPCDGVAACGMARPLPAGEALYRQFPRAYRIAHQIGLGDLALCYTDLAWLQRRTEPSPLGGRVMAVYHGRLGFTLEGRYRHRGQTQTVFAQAFVSAQEYPYLFGPNQPEVLADPCPREYQGRRIEGWLPKTRAWLVPSRVTFMSTARTPLPQLFAANWVEGEHWRRQLAGAGAPHLAMAPGAGIQDAISARLAELRLARTAFLYRLLSPGPRGEAGDGALGLSGAAGRLAAPRAVLDATARLLWPESTAHQAALRGSLRGSAGLLGLDAFLRLHAEGVAAVALPDLGRQRLQRYAPAWRHLEQAARVELPAPVSRVLIRLYQAQARWAQAKAAPPASAVQSDAGSPPPSPPATSPPPSAPPPKPPG